MGVAGLEPAAAPCKHRDLQQTIALNREIQAQDRADSPRPGLAELARQLQSLSPEDRAALAVMLPPTPAPGLSRQRQTPPSAGERNSHDDSTGGHR